MATRIRGMKLQGRRGFTLVELLVVIAIIAILVLLLLPAVNAARQAAQTNTCIGKLKNVGLALKVFEGANGRYPLVSTADAPVLGSGPLQGGGNGTAVAPGTATGDGFSWASRLLPELDQAAVFDQLKNVSGRFQGQRAQNAFAATVLDAGGVEHISATPIAAFSCPSYSGRKTVQSSIFQLPGTKEAAVGNYVATAGSALQAGNSSLLQEDGVIVSRAESVKGIKVSEVRDGESNTVMATESRDENVSSWLSGSGPRRTAKSFFTLPLGGSAARAAGEGDCRLDVVRRFSPPRSVATATLRPSRGEGEGVSQLLCRRYTP
jgi:prepilin-type N-terminal cleavage/methylation domain-containing protein